MGRTKKAKSAVDVTPENVDPMEVRAVEILDLIGVDPDYEDLDPVLVRKRKLPVTEQELMWFRIGFNAWADDVTAVAPVTLDERAGWFAGVIEFHRLVSGFVQVASSVDELLAEAQPNVQEAVDIGREVNAKQAAELDIDCGSCDNVETSTADEAQEYTFAAGSPDVGEAVAHHPAQDPLVDGSCVCGHSPEEHGNNPEYPGSTGCNEQDDDGEPCDCIAFEAAS